MNNKPKTQNLNSNNINNNSRNYKNKVWKPFYKLIAKAKMPYWWIVICIVFTLTQSKIFLMVPQYAQKIFSGDISKRTVIIASLLIVGQNLVMCLVLFFNSYTGAKISLGIRKAIWKQLIYLPIPFYDNNMPREMISRTTSDTTKLSDFFSASVANSIGSIYQLVGTFIILFSYNWRLAAIEGVILPLLFLIGIVNGRLSFKWNNLVQAYLAKLTEFLSEILINIPLMKSFANEKKEEKRGEECIDKLYITNFRLSCVTNVIQLLNNLTGDVLQTVVIIVVGIYLISAKIITVPIWIAFYMYAKGLSQNVTDLMSFWASLKTCQGAVRRISEITIEPLEKYDNALKCDENDADIRFENVSFKYCEKDILNNVSFKIQSGKVTAIVGPSGVGKSTIFSLIERFYKPNSGSIKIGDKTIDDFNLQDWRRDFGYVSQDTQLFSGTIRDNIAYGLGREVSEKEIINAAKEAYAYEFIKDSENGLDTEVGERGSRLSGGQRQRIAIARAILKNPKYLLLDEATSSLDAESEYMVDKALKKLSAGKTTIVIAHRLSTIEDADQIIMLDKKQVSGIGSHKSLLENNTLYKKLLEIQQKAEIC